MSLTSGKEFCDDSDLLRLGLKREKNKTLHQNKLRYKNKAIHRMTGAQSNLAKARENRRYRETFRFENSLLAVFGVLKDALIQIRICTKHGLRNVPSLLAQDRPLSSSQP